MICTTFLSLAAFGLCVAAQQSSSDDVVNFLIQYNDVPEGGLVASIVDTVSLASEARPKDNN
jgi:hypothetical protein